jgi:hypothetical protein
MRARGFAIVILLALVVTTTFAARVCDLACATQPAAHACCPAGMVDASGGGTTHLASAARDCGGDTSLAVIQLVREARPTRGDVSLVATTVSAPNLATKLPFIHAQAHYRISHAATPPPLAAVLRV